MVPESPVISLGGGTPFCIHWERLGIQKPLFEHELLDDLDLPNELNPTMCLEIADKLRRTAANLNLDDEFEADEYNTLQSYVHVLQMMHDHSKPSFFLKMLKDDRPGLIDARRAVKLKFDSTFMLRALMMSDMLRSSANLLSVVRLSLHTIVPPVLMPMFQAVLDDSIKVAPHESTVSRWRLLLDACFMLWMRKHNEDNACVRYMMTDSSTQKGRTFQLTAMQSISLDAVPRCYHDANALISMWSRPQLVHSCEFGILRP